MDRTAGKPRLLEERHSLIVFGLVLAFAVGAWAWRSAVSGAGQDQSPRGHIYTAVALHRAIWQSPTAWYGREVWIHAVLRAACLPNACGMRGADTPSFGFIDRSQGTLDADPYLPLDLDHAPVPGFSLTPVRGFPFVAMTRFGAEQAPSYYHVRFDRQHPCLTTPLRAWLRSLPDCPVAHLLH